MYKLFFIFIIVLCGCKSASYPVPEIEEGEKIVFTCKDFTTKEGEIDIYAIDPDGKNEQKITSTPYPLFECNPQWLPDGERILFFTYCAGDYEGSDSYKGFRPYIMEFKQKKCYKIKKDWTYGWRPSWTKDGKMVVYAYFEGKNENGDIYTMDTNGKNKRNLTNTPDLDEDEPSIFSDGRKIVFVVNDRKQKTQDGLYLMDIENHDLKRLTNDPGDMAPSFSPDGKMIAFMKGKKEDREGMLALKIKLYIMDNDGKNARRILTDDYRGTEFTFSWSPDSKKIVFYGIGAEENIGLYTVNIDGSELKFIYSKKGCWNPSWRPRPKK